MGAWGMKSFENDEASDWLIDFEGSKEIKQLEKTISQIIRDGARPDVPECAIAIAAAELVAALKGSPAEDLPDSANEWAKSQDRSRLNGLLDNAIMAVSKIKNGSELQESWKMSGALDGWLESVNDLEKRLSS